MTRSFLAARSADPAQFQDAHHNLPSTARNPRSHTLGIVGLGNIGLCVARKAYAAFGMKIVYHDIVRKPREQESDVGATFYPNVEDMLRVTDCLLLANPSTFSGRPFLTKEMVALLPRGARFVNIARGMLVDEDALADALESGHLVAAGLDVHFDEPNVSKRLAGMDNVTMTCHNGGGVVETRVGFERLAMENVEAVLVGREPSTPVNKHLMGKKEGQQQSVVIVVNGDAGNGHVVHGDGEEERSNGTTTDSMGERSNGTTTDSMGEGSNGTTTDSSMDDAV